MPIDLAALGLEKLSVRDRLELIDVLWESIPDQLDRDSIPDWHIAELERRKASAANNPGSSKPWRQVVDAIEAKS